MISRWNRVQCSVSESVSRKLRNLRKIINVVRKLSNLQSSVIFVKYVIYLKLEHCKKKMFFFLFQL